MLKRIAAAVAALLLLPAVSVKASSPPDLSAVSAILMDAESGRVLFEKNAHEERAIASITKLMTALVAAESGHDPSEMVTVRPEWTGIEGSSIYLQPGEVVSFETLLYGLLLNSGNDAAVALSAFCSGSVDAFVGQMNQYARKLGMLHTHFSNPNGLSEAGHYSTAYDMVLLARACINNDLVAKITATKSIKLGTRTFSNHNKLLWYYKDCTGMKTGFTEAAGRTLVSSAQRNGQTLIAVTLNAPDDWNDHASLLDYGFEKFPRKILCNAETLFFQVPLHGSLKRFMPANVDSCVYYPLTEGEHVRSRIEVDVPVKTPVKKGEYLGTLSFYLGDSLIGETQVIASEVAFHDIADSKTNKEHLRLFLKKIT